LSVSVTFGGCREKAQENSVHADYSPSSTNAGGAVEKQNSVLIRRDANTLFSSTEVPVFELSLPSSEWEALQRNAVREEYTSAKLWFEGEAVGWVGLRFKGGHSTLFACVEREANARCAKLSMKIKFNKYQKRKRLFGLERLNFHGMTRDATKMSDKIAYELFRNMGIVAPRSHWARLVINGKSQGLFALVEQIDGQFAADRFEVPVKGNGNLYKEVWPIDADESYFARGIKTNKHVATHERFVAFGSELASAKPHEVLSVLDKWSDTDQLYAYMAVDDAISNWDGISAWYCEGEICDPHNYYWYVDETKDKFTLIPWDMDQALTIRTPLAHIPHWTTQPSDCRKRYKAFRKTELTAPGCEVFFQGLLTERSRYADAIQKLLDGPFQEKLIHAKIDRYADIIEDEIAKDPALVGVESWRASVDDLKERIPLLILKLEALRDGQEITPLSLDPTSLTDFESLGELQFALGIDRSSNPNSTSSQSLNQTDPIEGMKDARFNFTFVEETDSSKTWHFVVLPIEGGENDLSLLTGIRLSIVADQDRTVRLDLQSREYSQKGGRRFGWEIGVSDTPTRIALRFTDAHMPAWANPKPPETIEEILTNVHALVFRPSPIRDADGSMGGGAQDTGFLQVDSIEFF
jgi:hypothetical protein